MLHNIGVRFCSVFKVVGSKIILESYSGLDQADTQSAGWSSLCQVSFGDKTFVLAGSLH